MLSLSAIFYIVLGSLFPAILYSLTIWASMPLNYVNLKRGLSYLIPGFASVVVIDIVHVTFPHFFQPVYTGAFSMDMFYKTFFQISMIEEFSKWICLYIAINHFKSFSDNPLSIMYYGGVVGAGFAIVENIFYGIHYGSQLLPLVRGASATIAHMSCGLLMGYWIAHAYCIEKRNRTYFSLVFKAFPRLKVAAMTFMGIFTATFMHGLYDFNLYMESPSMHPLLYIVLAIGVIVCYLAAKDLAKNICENA